MEIFNNFRKINIAYRKKQEVLYSIVSQEMESGVRHNGLWLKALELAGGSKEKQVAEYIKLRVQSLKDDINIISKQSTMERNLSFNRNTEEFVTILSDGSPVEKIEAYVSGMSPQEIHEFVNQPDTCENYPIHIAIKKGRVDLARWLLKAGANPRLENYWGKTALEIAERNKNADAIALLQQYTTTT